MRVLLRVTAFALSVAVLVVLLVAARIVWVGREDARPVSDAVVVLGTAQFDGRPSRIFAARLDHALELYRDGIAPRVITVGGSLPGDRFTEAGAARDYLVDAGVPPQDVVAVETGGDTLASLEAVGAAMAEQGWADAVLVTDPWHSLRSRAMARGQGIDAVTSPTRDGPPLGAGSAARYLARETAGLLAYRADRLLPGS